MLLRRSFVWDVLAYPSPIAWFVDLHDQGWTRVPGVPGVTTGRGTVVYEFFLMARPSRITRRWIRA